MSIRDYNKGKIDELGLVLKYLNNKINKLRKNDTGDNIITSAKIQTLLLVRRDLMRVYKKFLKESEDV